MDRPCCVGVVRDASALAGKEITVGKSLKAYYASPKVKTGKRMGIVVVHDIFGFALPNCKYVADHFASKGYDAVMPDFYSGKKDVEPSAWPATETEITKPLEGDDFNKFFGSITSDSFWEQFKSEVDDATAFLRRKGCVRYGIIGFCWGGIAAEKAAMGGRFSAMISVHGCMHTAETYKQVKGSSLYITVNGDAFFPKEGQDAIRDAGGKVKVYDGMGHGFAVRGDFSDKAVKDAADDAMSEAEKLFGAACLRKPKYTKVGSLNPNSKGFTCLVKIVGDVTEVQEPRKGGGAPAKFYEVACGDDTGRVTLSLKDFQKEGMDKGRVLAVRNASVRMVKGYIRVVVDKWGKLDFNVEGGIEGEVGDKNMSTVEYELVG